MIRALLTLTLILLGILQAKASECLPSAKAVWAAHPGSHATWKSRKDGKCWFVLERKVMPIALHDTSQNFGSRVGSRQHDTRPRSASLPAGAETLTRFDEAFTFPPYRERVGEQLTNKLLLIALGKRLLQ